MSGDNRHAYLEAMHKKEIAELLKAKKDTWKLVPRSTDAIGKNILPDAFNIGVQKETLSRWSSTKVQSKILLQRRPSTSRGSGLLRNLCSYAGRMEHNTSAPHNETLTNGSDMRQVDYTYAFDQADTKEEVFVELPQDYAARSESAWRFCTIEAQPTRVSTV
jgi:hypothetical protein